MTKKSTEKPKRVLLPAFAAGSRLLTLQETAEFLRIHERTLYDWMYQGEIPSYKVGRNRKFKLDQILHWLEGKREDVIK